MSTKSFKQLAERNPTLLYLERICELLRMDLDNKATKYWYDTIKPIVVQNVGNMCKGDSVLGTSEAYDTVYHHLCKKLGM